MNKVSEESACDAQKSCRVNVKIFKRNSERLRKKNTCSICKRAFERFFTPERVT